MIPYFSATTLHIGPIPIQVWGSFVAIGIVLGAYASARFAKHRGLNPDLIYSGATWIIVAAFIGARLMHVLAYEPSYYLHRVGDVFAFWLGGYSVMGGFLGAIVGYVLFVKNHKMDWIAYTDAFVYGLPLGLGCGRIGCFLIHDHPGTLTHFILGVRYPDGSIRHDNGLYESLQSFALAIVFYILYRTNESRPVFFYAQVFLAWYGVVRFFLDFTRVADVRYAGLTPAQFGCVGMVFAAVYLGRYRQKQMSMKSSIH